MRSRSLLAAALALVAVPGCQSPDVGQPCTLAWNPMWQQQGTQPPPKSSEVTADYFESGNLACDGLICIVSPAPAGSEYYSTVPGRGYCSKSCISNSDCYPSETGLVCRQMLLDPAFLLQLDPLTAERYVASIKNSSYCSVPR